MNSETGCRIERDSLGEINVPETALYGAQTQRAIDNFQFSELRMPRSFIRALGLIKRASAQVNGELGLLPENLSAAIQTAAQAVADGHYDEQFPVDVFQTGSGTSTNMNANEVIASLVARDHNIQVHPNDHVNMGQSSNDVIPCAIHLSAMLLITEKLQPSLTHLVEVIEIKASSLSDVVKTGRTHLMDAMPLTMSQEMGGWGQQIKQSRVRIGQSSERLQELAIGGTAVGTGINTHPHFGSMVAAELSVLTSNDFRPKPNYFEALSCQDSAVEMSGQLKTLAVALMKISNDLRWMNSGPLNGLAELVLPELQPGSSIMPGKINPVIPEAVAMACAQVMGNDTAITIAGQSGNFQLNVMLPIIAKNLLFSIELMANSATALADRAIAAFHVNREEIEAMLERNPILVTALNREIGYEQGAAIAKQAYAQKRPILDVATEVTGMSRARLQDLLNPQNLINQV